MNQEELERFAAKNAPMPDGLDVPEQYLFLALRGLYLAYRAGGMGKAQAKQEKTKVMETYKDLALKWKIVQQHMRMLRTVQKYEGSIRESGCEVCRGLYRALCGLEVHGGTGGKNNDT